MPRNPRPKIKDCPFRVGDVVRINPEYAEKVTGFKGFMATVIKRCTIPITETLWVEPERWEGGLQGVIKSPYWVYLKESQSKGVNPYWVGYLELDPFLGHAKRAVMDANL